MVEREVLGQVDGEVVGGGAVEEEGGVLGIGIGFGGVLGIGRGAGFGGVGHAGRSCAIGKIAVDARRLFARLGACGFAHHHARVDERGEDLGGAGLEGSLLLRRLQRVIDERQHATPGVAALLDLGQDHGVGDAQTGLERFGRALDEALEGALVPGHEALGRFLLLELLHLLGVAHGFELGLVVLDLVLGRLGDDHALGIVTRAAGAARDLVELA